MSMFEFWLPIHVNGQPACTIYGRIDIPVRPLPGERVSFHQEKGSNGEFQVEWPNGGWARENVVSVKVEEISHYASRTKQGVQFTSAVRTAPLNVRALEDARTVRDILTKQLGRSLDPYAINTLGDRE